ncbi:predicted protein [Coccidioides posadasii str. Silveira]|uniref:Predicted protein n=1 Tax=Coccidioides posadasii (strain RMSCC 757 / Silveira) TaxID=443226 RepID=E9CZR0_COCPS|nr:predicted protein [Coccidioides posadasii str. Silveira]
MPRSDRLVSPLIVSRVPTMQVASQNQNPSCRSPPNTFMVRQPSQRVWIWGSSSWASANSTTRQLKLKVSGSARLLERPKLQDKPRNSP